MSSALAITGGTGFLGGHVLRLAAARNIHVRALARRPQPPISGIEWIAGALGDAAALDGLIAGASAILHIAGVVNAPDRAGFAAGNIAGTQSVIEAATRAGIRRLVTVSSLAAREPGLSNYGWSKAEADALTRRSTLDWTIIRPPAIYGPGDTEMLDLFRMASRGVVLLPPSGRLSLIAAEDLARLLLDTVDDAPSVGRIYEPDDGQSDGWDHRDFGRALGAALGRPVRTLSVPAPVLRLASQLDRLARGGKAKLTADRVRYFTHPDWVATADARPPHILWAPEIETVAGLRETARWYRARGLLKG